MGYKEKIIEDIVYSIRECLKWIKLHYNNLNSLLVASPNTERELSRIIYLLYNIDPKMVYYFNDVYILEIKEEYKKAVNKSNEEFKKKLFNAYKIVYENRDKLTIDVWGVWVQVMFKGDEAFANDIKRRLYLNCNPEYIDFVIAKLVDLMIHGFYNAEPPRIIFKFPYYDKIREHELLRSDKIVIYYDNNPVTHEILRDWVGSIGKYLHEAVPLFTRKERNGAAFGYELPPDQQEYAKLHTGEEASFGGFMSLVIARYLHSWCVHYQKIPNNKEITQIAYDIFEEKLKGKFKFFGHAV